MGCITGLGVVSCGGLGREPFWETLREGRCALRPIARFDASPFRNSSGGEVAPLPLPPGGGGEELPPVHIFLLRAAEEALADAGLSGPSGGAIVVGTNFGAFAEAAEALSRGAPEAGIARGLLRFRFQGAADLVASRLGLRGPRFVLSLSCACGAAVVGAAVDLLEDGEAPFVLALGCDELSPWTLSGLNALRALGEGRVRPFDRDRGGTVFSEGAAAVVVEPEPAARARGARIYGRVLGHALDNDAFHMTAPEKEGRGIAAVMEAALRDAGIAPADVDHVNAHGTGTLYNDRTETEAVKRVFGEAARRIPVLAMKGALGHGMGAAGLHEIIGSLLAARDGILPPTVGLENPDPACDLDYVQTAARPRATRRFLSNSYGIGGTNAAVVIEKV